MEILNCKEIRQQEIINLKKKLTIPLSLAVIQIGDFKENNLYLRSKQKLANELGISLLLFSYNKVNKEEIIEKIKCFNENPNIFGIMIQKPILADFDYQELVDYIVYYKDVDGVSNESKMRLAKGEDCLFPCTAQAVLKVFQTYDLLHKNKKIAIIGKSNLVGQPLYQILKKKYTVMIYDSKTEFLAKKLKEADLIISAIGKARFFTNDYFQDGQVIIDVGTNYVDGKLIGDVDRDSIEPLSIKITSVPGGIGLLTPVYLFYNLYYAFLLQMKK